MEPLTTGDFVDEHQPFRLFQTWYAEAQASEKYFGGRMGEILAETATFLADVGEVDSAGSVEFYTERVYSDALEAVAQE